MSVRLGGTGARRQRLGRGTQERKGLGDRRTVAASPAPATALADGAADPRFRRMILHERPNQLAADSAARCAESASIPPTCAGRRAGSLQFQPARGRTPIAVTLTSARMSPLRPWNAHDQAEPEGVVAGTRQATAPTRCSHALPDLAIAAAPVHPQRALPRARGVHGREPVIRPIRSLPVRRPLRGVARVCRADPKRSPASVRPDKARLGCRANAARNRLGAASPPPRRWRGVPLLWASRSAGPHSGSAD